MPSKKEASKKDANFCAKFNLPTTERISEDFSCAINRDILLHGRMYVSAGYICFYSKIFGHRTMEVMPFRSITAIEKKNTSLFIPNAIEITLRPDTARLNTARHFFASFLHRDITIARLRDMVRPALRDTPAAAPLAS